MFARRPRRLISAAAAAAVWAVLAPAPSAEAGHADPARVDRLAASLQVRAASAAEFGLRTGDPRFSQFGAAANVLANEAGVLRAKLAAGDITAVRVCTAKIGRVVKDIDKLEDRLPRHAACGRSLRGARKAADRLADGIEDVYDDLEDEVDDLRIGRVGFAGYAPQPAGPAPPVVVCPAPPRPAPVCPGYATCLDPNCDHGFPAAPAHGGRFDAAPRGGFGDVYREREVIRERGVQYGPAPGFGELRYDLGRPAGSLDGFDSRGGLYGTPPAGYGDGFRDRDRFDGRGFEGRGYDGGFDGGFGTGFRGDFDGGRGGSGFGGSGRFDLNAAPPLPAPGPQASAGWGRAPLGSGVTASFRR